MTMLRHTNLLLLLVILTGCSDHDAESMASVKEMGQMVFRDYVSDLQACSTISARLYRHSGSTKPRHQENSDIFAEQVDTFVAMRTCDNMQQARFAICRSECGSEALIRKPEIRWSQPAFEQCRNTRCGEAPQNSKQCTDGHSSYKSDYIIPNANIKIDLAYDIYGEKEKEDIAIEFFASNCTESIEGI